MKSVRISLSALSIALLFVASSPHGNSQSSKRAHNQQPSNPQAGSQSFAVGDAIEIQAADGSWIQGNVRNYNQANGKYEVVLANSMSGWAAPEALRRTSAAGSAGQSAGIVSAASQPAMGSAGGANCSAGVGCIEKKTFIATVTDFRVSTQGNWKIADVTVRFLNKASQPLTIGYVDQSGIMLDDQGNRLQMKDDALRGIGVIRPNGMDGKFAMQAGESADAQFEFVLQQSSTEIFGTGFEMNLTLREMNAAGASQFTLGPEYPLHFVGLSQTTISAGASSGAQVSGPGVPVPAQGFVGNQTVQTSAVDGANAAPGGVVQPVAVPGAQQTGTKKGRFGGLGSLAGQIPGMTGALGQTAVGAKVTNVMSNVNIPGLQPSGNGSEGGASGVASQAATMIPGFQANAGQTSAGKGAVNGAGTTATSVTAASPASAAGRVGAQRPVTAAPGTVPNIAKTNSAPVAVTKTTIPATTAASKTAKTAAAPAAAAKTTAPATNSVPASKKIVKKVVTTVVTKQ